jgi:hypothetical protein
LSIADARKYGASGPRVKRRPHRRTEVISLGRCLIGDLDSVAEALAVAEGKAFR